MKIGIATPIHEKDYKYTALNKLSVQELNPKAYIHLAYPNDGKRGLKYYRTYLFNHLFDIGCDIVLNCSVDHFLFKDILTFIEEDKVTTFAYFKKRISFLLDFIRFKLSPNMWTGVYAFNKEFWELLKKDESFDGNDSSVMRFAQKINYPVNRIRRPSYMLMNPSKGKMFLEDEKIPSWKKIIRLISWGDH